MLPAILKPSLLNTAKTSLIAGVTALAVMMSGATEAQAWGKGEQNFVAGAATALLLNSLIQNANRYPQPPIYRAPVYRAPVYQAPVYRPPVYQPPVYQAPRYRYHRPVRYEPAPVSIYGTPAGLAFNSYSSDERRRIQSTLTAYGYYHSGIDGSFGPATYGALDAYARRTGKTSLLASRAGAFSLLDGLLF